MRFLHVLSHKSSTLTGRIKPAYMNGQLKGKHTSMRLVASEFQPSGSMKKPRKSQTWYLFSSCGYIFHNSRNECLIEALLKVLCFIPGNFGSSFVLCQLCSKKENLVERQMKRSLSVSNDHDRNRIRNQLSPLERNTCAKLPFSLPRHLMCGSAKIVFWRPTCLCSWGFKVTLS